MDLNLNSLLEYSSYENSNNGGQNQRPSMTGSVCVVCGDRASGRHYGAISCEGCKGFFKRSIRKQLGYSCRGNQNCEVNLSYRNRCQYCRLQKCLRMGMSSDSVQLERTPTVKNGKQPASSAQVFASSTDSFVLNDYVDNVQNESIESIWENNSGVPLAEQIEITKTVETISRVLNESDEDQNEQTIAFFENLDLKNLIPEGYSDFSFTRPSPSLYDGDDKQFTYISEISCRLFVTTVQWTRLLPMFKALPLELQTSLLKSTWPELFAIGLIQCVDVLPLSTVASAVASHLQNNGSFENMTSISNLLVTLKYFLKEAASLAVDDYECAALKVVCLLTSGRLFLFGISSSVTQSFVLEQLQAYVEKKVPVPGASSTRLMRMFVMLGTIRQLNIPALMELFIQKQGESLQMDNVITQMMRIDAEAFNSTVFKMTNESSDHVNGER